MKPDIRGRAVCFARRHRDKLIKAAAAILIIAALLFFGEYGEKRSDVRVASSAAAEEPDGSIVIETESQTHVAMIAADISGAVADPGVYEIPEGSRLEDLIELAGGLSEDADIDSINRASLVVDGQKVYIPYMDDGYPALSSGGTAPASSSDGEGEKVDINTADLAELQNLPGVGPVTAQRIIDYREQNGGFSSVEDLINVSGIGEARLEKMKAFVVI